MTMRARTFVVPSTGLPYRSPDPLPGWACPVVATGAPVVPVDRETRPSGDELLGQVLHLAPRGRAWQTDEVRAPLGTTIQHGVWAVVADAMAAFYATLTRAGVSAFPSVGDEAAVAAFEADYGLPEPCLGDLPTLPERRQAIRAALAAPETVSRQDLVCLLSAAGFSTTVEEWEGFEAGWSGFGEEGFGHPDLPHAYFVQAPSLPLTWLTFAENGFGEEGFGSLPADPLICLVERTRQAHTRVFYVIEGSIL